MSEGIPGCLNVLYSENDRGITWIPTDISDSSGDMVAKGQVMKTSAPAECDRCLFPTSDPGQDLDERRISK